jgi:hypothetical protein
MTHRDDDNRDLRAALNELVRKGELVPVFDPESGEDRYCTPAFLARSVNKVSEIPSWPEGNARPARKASSG